MLFDLPLTDLGECATGQHTWQQTKHTGIVVCEICGIMGYCRSCHPTMPPGAPVHSCRFHRHAAFRLHDCTRPLSAVKRMS